MRFGWSKQLTLRAMSESKGIVCMKSTGKHLGKAGDHVGTFEFCGAMEQSMAVAVWCFVYAIYQGKTPAEAFEQIKWPATAEQSTTTI